jgi:DNA polymerase-3 subunit chi
VTKVDFYTGSSDKLRTACQLSHKAMQNGMRVLLHTPDTRVADALDKLLWHYPPTAFIPHCRSHEADAANMPVVLGNDGETFPHSELLISLHTECLPFFSRFGRLIEIVGMEEEDKRQGRERFKFYKDRGYEMRHFDLSKS